MFSDELRLGDEHKTLDDAINADRVAAKRDEIGWDNMTYEQKKNKDFLNMQSIEMKFLSYLN